MSAYPLFVFSTFLRPAPSVAINGEITFQEGAGGDLNVTFSAPSLFDRNGIIAYFEVNRTLTNISGSTSFPSSQLNVVTTQKVNFEQTTTSYAVTFSSSYGGSKYTASIIAVVVGEKRSTANSQMITTQDRGKMSSFDTFLSMVCMQRQHDLSLCLPPQPPPPPSKPQNSHQTLCLPAKLFL